MLHPSRLGVIVLFSSTVGLEIVLLLAAFALCSLIGLERQLRQKSAGYRTHVLVGMGSCVFTLVSAFGFKTVLGDEIVLDPSRIAAQVVSGIGFLGAGVIFKGRNMVRGLTTAATVWVAAAVGMACGAGMVPLAAALTVLQLIVLFAIAPLVRRIPSSSGKRTVRLVYVDGAGVLRDILGVAGEMGFSATVRSTRRVESSERRSIVAQVQFFGARPLQDLMSSLAELEGVERLRLESEADSDDDIEQ